jgi:FtsZ-binding cell division protein ZapB
MRLTPEQVAEEKKYLSELKERVWIGEKGLTSAEQDLFDTIEALQQENEQLRAQVARMREALFDYKTFLESFQCGCEPSDETCPGVYCERCCRLNQANETLDEIDKAIGGGQ